ncbi:MAG TPA: carbamoyltransferase HypF [Candidatus Binataceae bacterium]|nr:carbamoyltransferase HypF [Candidatus Binataceae bacterium]
MTAGAFPYETDAAHPRLEGRRITVQGIVQGVGFRPFVYRLARAEGVTGRVRNDPAGATIDVFGPHDALERFCHRLVSAPPPAAKLIAVAWSPIGPDHCEGFEIGASEREGERRVSIPADIAVCPECLAEVFDRDNRRFGYAFTNCTNCGPRFTIALDVPYDRPATTMAPFAMCPECRREYEDPNDRRFHAQPNACPQCGPRLWLLDANGERADSADPIETAAAALRSSSIVAIKGLGGFHIACDATAAIAVGRLRDRKRREAKPLAVMVRDLADAERIAMLTDLERELLCAPERPIVLAARRAGANLADEVAPGSPLVGVMLAYTPLHHLLLAAAGRPLVMTSANLSDEPIAYRNEEAVRRLRGIADLFLVHNREIVTRCDDSVARVIAGAPTILRRSRGYVPRPVPVDPPFEQPILAVGAHLKNAFCLGVGDMAWFGPHIGDLETLETYEAFEEAVERMERFIGVTPEVIAHDLHPGYLSTEYALKRNAAVRMAVQHHHAHVASAMAEHQLAGPVIGVAYDGTGYGTDGAMWGGELLLADLGGFQRLGTFRPIPLAGGDRAIREVWRLALALVDDAFDGNFAIDRLTFFRNLDLVRISAVRSMIRTRLNTPSAHGVGRYFDAVGALVLGETISRYEGQIAAALNNCADVSERGRYEFELDRAMTPWTLDMRPAVRQIVEAIGAREDRRSIAARFHNTLIEATAAMVRADLSEHGPRAVVLTGGCFQNPLLAEGVVRAIGNSAPVHLHRDVPPGDGGIALGQAMAAAARMRAAKANGGS